MCNDETSAWLYSALDLYVVAKPQSEPFVLIGYTYCRLEAPGLSPGRSDSSNLRRLKVPEGFMGRAAPDKVLAPPVCHCAATSFDLQAEICGTVRLALCYTRSLEDCSAKLSVSRSNQRELLPAGPNPKTLVACGSLI